MYQKGNKELEILCLYLGDYIKSFYLREISKLSKLPLKTTQNILKKLEEKKILKAVLHGKNKYFSLNLDNIETKNYILQAEIYKTNLLIKKYPIFKTFLKELKSTSLLVIFGSFAQFIARKDSDLDLLIVPKKEKEEIPLHLLPYKIHKISLNEKNFLKAVESEEKIIKEIFKNHVILNNHSFFVNIAWNKIS